MEVKAVTMSLVLALVVGFLLTSSEGRALDDVIKHPAGAPSPSSSDVSPLKKEDTSHGEGQPEVKSSDGDEGESKTFAIISHVLGKIPFPWNKNKDTVTTVTTSNAVPGIPLSGATVTSGK